MAKSRLAAGLVLIGWQTAAMAAPQTADQAMAQYRRTFRPVEELRCPKSVGPEDIVVCGRREGRDPDRVPLPDEREPGERVTSGRRRGTERLGGPGHDRSHAVRGGGAEP